MEQISNPPSELDEIHGLGYRIIPAEREVHILVEVDDVAGATVGVAVKLSGFETVPTVEEVEKAAANYTSGGVAHIPGFGEKPARLITLEEYRAKGFED